MTRPRREAMGRRFEFFRRECPGAGDRFPALEGRLLEGGTWRSADHLGHAQVIEAGSFT